MRSIQTSSIAVAGCGAMGLPMAQNLFRAGYKINGYDIRPSDEFGDFESRMLPSAGEAARRDVVFSVVRDWSQTETLCFAEGGLFTTDKYPGILVVCSTLSPKRLQELAEKVPQGVTLVDAPMSGAPYRAENATLTFMLGGETEVIQHLKPLFDCMGSHIHHLGCYGQGMTCKVLNNLLAATSTRAVREVMQAAERLAFPVDTLLEVARTSSGSTWFGDHFNEIDWSREGYDPENTIGILEKDVNALRHALEDFPDQPVHELSQQVINGLKKLKPCNSN